MKGIILFGLILLILIGGASAFFYFFKEKSGAEQEIQLYHNFSIKFIDNSTKKEVPIDYLVLSDDGLFSRKGIYYGEEYSLENLITNKSFNIYNINSSRCYYTEKYSYPQIYEPQTVRADIYVDSCGELKISHSGRLLYYEPIILNISSSGLSKGLGFCITWSRNILSVSIEANKTDIPVRLKNKVVKCYDLERDIKNEDIILNLDYKNSAPLQIEDKIKIYLIDSDYRSDLNMLSFENEHGKDFAIPDILYEIK